MTRTGIPQHLTGLDLDTLMDTAAGLAESFHRSGGSPGGRSGGDGVACPAGDYRATESPIAPLSAGLQPFPTCRIPRPRIHSTLQCFHRLLLESVCLLSVLSLSANESRLRTFPCPAPNPVYKLFGGQNRVNISC